MHGTPARNPQSEVFSLQEIARAAALTTGAAREQLRLAGIRPLGRYVALDDAVRLVRILKGQVPATDADRPPVTLVPESPRRAMGPLIASGLLHAGLVGLLTAVTALGLLAAKDTDQHVAAPPTRLIYTISLGPGGGGGGGGMRSPIPPPPAELEAPINRISSPVPAPRRVAPPPRPPRRPLTPPRRPVRIDPVVETPTPPPVPPAEHIVVAPVVQVPGDSRNVAGLMNAPPAPPTPSLGSGQGGGIGSGTGTGTGEGQGAGLGPGSGGGTGGGPYRPGSGVTPPTIAREVPPQYTTDARRRAIEGDVDLEIVVRADGSVGQVRIVRGLEPGLDQRASEAVRQWRFNPARRQGAPVAVVVQVSVEFKLR